MRDVFLVEEDEFDELSIFFSIFSDSTRLKIINVLFNRELCVGDIANQLNMSHSAISHQLGTLKRTRLVKSKKVGKSVFYALADEHIESIFRMAYEHIKE